MLSSILINNWGKLVRENEEGLTQQEQQDKLFQEWRQQVTDNRFRAAETVLGLWWVLYWSDDISPLYLNRLVILIVALLLTRSYNQANNVYRTPIARFDAAEKFRRFAAQNNVPKVQQCIGVFGSRDLNPINFDNGMSPLHYAVKGLAFNTVELLKNCGANINLQDAEDNTPIHTAIMNILRIESDCTATYKISINKTSARDEILLELSKRRTPSYKILAELITKNTIDDKSTLELKSDTHEKMKLESARKALLELEKDKPTGYDTLVEVVRPDTLDDVALIQSAKKLVLLQLAFEKALAYNILLGLLSPRKDPKIQAGLAKLKASGITAASADSVDSNQIPSELLALAKQLQGLDINLNIDPTLKNSKQETILDLLERVGDQTCVEYKTAYSKIRTLAEQPHQAPMPRQAP
jgi:hypothetical protein